MEASVIPRYQTRGAFSLKYSTGQWHHPLLHNSKMLKCALRISLIYWYFAVLGDFLGLALNTAAVHPQHIQHQAGTLQLVASLFYHLDRPLLICFKCMKSCRSVGLFDRWWGKSTGPVTHMKCWQFMFLQTADTFTFICVIHNVIDFFTTCRVCQKGCKASEHWLCFNICKW